MLGNECECRLMAQLAVAWRDCQGEKSCFGLELFGFLWQQWLTQCKDNVARTYSRPGSKNSCHIGTRENMSNLRPRVWSTCEHTGPSQRPGPLLAWPLALIRRGFPLVNFEGEANYFGMPGLLFYCTNTWVVVDKGSRRSLIIGKHRQVTTLELY